MDFHRHDDVRLLPATRGISSLDFTVRDMVAEDLGLGDSELFSLTGLELEILSQLLSSSSVVKTLRRLPRRLRVHVHMADDNASGLGDMYI